MSESKYDKNLGYSVPNKEFMQKLEAEANQVQGQVVPTVTQIKSQESVNTQSFESAPQEEQPVEQQEQVEEEVVQEVQTQQKQKETPQESFGNLKRKSQQMERERDEAIRKLAIYEQQRSGNAANNELSRYEGDKYSQQAPQEEPEITIADDDLAEGKHLRSLKKQIKSLEERIKQTQQVSHETVVENRLKNMYPDFDSVVTLDNIRELRETEPEIAATLNANQDLYSKAVSTYKMIKKLNISYEEKEMAKKNSAKPRPLTSIAPQQGSSALSKANEFAQGLTEDLKKQLWKEMMEAKKAR